MTTLAHGTNINLGHSNGMVDAIVDTFSSLVLALQLSHRAENADLSNADNVTAMWTEYETAITSAQ